MIQFNPAPAQFVPTAHPHMAGLHDNVNQQNFIPEPAANAATTAPRPVADDYDKNQTTTVGDPRPAPDPARAAKSDSSDGSLTRQDNGRSDDSSGQGRRDAQQRQQELAAQAAIRELSARDAQVRAHEVAHASVGGQYAGAPSYQYKRGPDGRSYAVGGEVPIDATPVRGDPAATVRKLQTVANAALAPADPSPQDRRVASRAQAGIAEARAELFRQQRAEAAETETFRREGKTDHVDASRVTYRESEQRFFASPFGTALFPHSSAAVRGDQRIGIRLAAPMDIRSRLRDLGVTERASRDFRAIA